MKSCRGSSELIFVVLNFVTPEARYANDVNNRLKIRGWKNSWVENFVTRGIVTKITKISTPRKLPAIRYPVILLYYKSNAESIRSRKRDNYQNNPPNKKDASRTSYNADTNKAKETARKQYNNNPEPQKAASHDQYRIHSETIKEDARKQYKTKPEPKTRATRKQYSAHPEPKK